MIRARARYAFRLLMLGSATLLICLGTLADCTPARAAAPGAGASPAPRLGCARLCAGLALGYGHAIATRPRQRRQDVKDVRLLTLNPRLELGLLQLGSGSAWYHGTLSGVLEGMALLSVAPEIGHGGGALLMLRYGLGEFHGVNPYTEGGGGIGRIEFDLDGQADGTSFLLTWGVGLRRPIHAGRALSAAVRWHHISNAQTDRPNTGVDDILFLLGIEFE